VWSIYVENNGEREKEKRLRMTASLEEKRVLAVGMGECTRSMISLCRITYKQKKHFSFYIKERKINNEY
jgi:hypothetical protein